MAENDLAHNGLDGCLAGFVMVGLAVVLKRMDIVLLSRGRDPSDGRQDDERENEFLQGIGSPLTLNLWVAFPRKRESKSLSPGFRIKCGMTTQVRNDNSQNRFWRNDNSQN